MGENIMGDNDNNNSQDGQGDQAPKTFKFKDPVNQKEYDLPVEFQETIGHINSVARKETQRKAEERLLTMQQQFNEKSEAYQKIEEELNALREQNMTAEQRAEAAIKREKQAWENEKKSLSEKSGKFENLFMTTKIENDLLGAMGGFELNNPAQAMRLLKDDGKAELVETEPGIFKTVLKLTDENGDVVEMTPSEAVKRYFAMPENLHHLKRNFVGGSGTPLAGSMDSEGAMIFSKAAIQRDSETRRKYNEAMKNGAKVKLV